MFVKSSAMVSKAEAGHIRHIQQATVRGSYDYYKANFRSLPATLRAILIPLQLLLARFGELIDGFANRNTSTTYDALKQIFGENQFVSPGPINIRYRSIDGGVHFTSDVEIDALAARWWIAIMCNVYHECKYKAPRNKTIGLSLTGKKVILLFESEEPLRYKVGLLKVSARGHRKQQTSAKVALATAT